MAARRSFRLGVTGGIGSGKSTFSAMLAERGAALVDADALSRSVTAAGGAAIAAVAAQFGPTFITSDGAMDRERMRQLAFEDAHARERLQAIVHPLVGAAIAQACRQAEQDGLRLIVLDIPLLTESGHWPARLDGVAVVDCPPAMQVERVRRRSGLQEEAVHAIMATQSPRPQRLAAADWVVFNGAGTTLADLRTKAHQIARSFGL